MADRYIRRDDAIVKACNAIKDAGIAWEVKNALKAVPVADVRENRHGYWIKMSKADRDGNVWCMCSECSAGDLQAPGVEVPFCWHCGAEMDLGYAEEDLEDEDDQ